MLGVMFQEVSLKKECPTRIKVVSWFFVVFGLLAAFSAIGSVSIGIADNHSLASYWGENIQIIISFFLVYGGRKLLEGSPSMRSYLEIMSYVIIALLFVFNASFVEKFGLWGPLISFTIYLVPMIFVIRALRSDIARAYASKET